MQNAKELLTNDYSGSGVKKLKDELFEMDLEVKAKMDSGLANEDMEIAKSYREAIELASQSIEIVYNKLNA